MNGARCDLISSGESVMTRFTWSLAVLALGCTQAPFTSPDIKEPARANVVVQISSAAVDPAVARVKEGGSVAWTNQSAFLAVLSFPGRDASEFNCKDLRPDFTKEGNTLQSLPFRSAPYPVVLPCSLKKGRYPYVINLVNGIANMGNPTFTLSAEITVE